MVERYSMSVRAIRGFYDAATAQGLNVQEALVAAECPHALDDVEGRVPWEVVERIAAAGVSQIGIVGIMRAMGAMRGERSGPLYYLAKHSPTVGVALGRIAKYGRVTNGLADYRLVVSPRSSRFELVQRQFLSMAYRRLISPTWAVGMVTVIRQIAGPDFEPMSISLEGPRPADPDMLRSYETALQPGLRFLNDRTVLEFDSKIMERKIADASPVLEAAMLHYVTELAADLPDDSTFARRLGQILVESIHGARCSVLDAAQQLGTTPRTMQRKLRDEGTSYTQVLDSVRQEIAISELREPNVTIEEIASLLGFDKVSSFHRAFKRWTGVTAGQFRKRRVPKAG